jgi:hypothetical protein
MSSNLDYIRRFLVKCFIVLVCNLILTQRLNCQKIGLYFAGASTILESKIGTEKSRSIFAQQYPYQLTYGLSYHCSKKIEVSSAFHTTSLFNLYRSKNGTGVGISAMQVRTLINSFNINVPIKSRFLFCFSTILSLSSYRYLPQLTQATITTSTFGGFTDRIETITDLIRPAKRAEPGVGLKLKFNLRKNFALFASSQSFFGTKVVHVERIKYYRENVLAEETSVRINGTRILFGVGLECDLGLEKLLTCRKK